MDWNISKVMISERRIARGERYSFGTAPLNPLAEKGAFSGRRSQAASWAKVRDLLSKRRCSSLAVGRLWQLLRFGLRAVEPWRRALLISSSFQPILE